MGTARETMDRLDEALATGDLEAGLACYAPDAVYVTPEFGELTGKEAIAAYLAGLPAIFPDLEFELTGRYEAGDDAIDEGIMTGTQTGPMQLYTGAVLPPTGKTVRIRSCDIAHVENGLIVRHRMYFDQVEFLRQLGAAAVRMPATAGEGTRLDDTV